jgi:hypothetical protein
VPDREPHTALVAVFAHTWIQATPNFRLTVEAVPVFQPDTTPNPLQFVTKNLAAPFVSYESNAVTISGINVPVPISIDGNAEYSINGRAYTSLPGTVSNGETVRLRMTLNAGQIERRTTLSAGSVTASWRMTIAP